MMMPVYANFRSSLSLAMPPLHVALATRALKEPLRRSVRFASDTGVTGIQFDAREELKPGELSETGIRQFRHQIGELGLHVASLAFPTRRSFYDEEQLDARIAAIRCVMDFARQLGTSVVTVRLGKIPADKESKDSLILYDVVSDLARYGNKVGATLAVSPTGDSPDALGELISSIKTGPIGIDFDPAAFVLCGHKPAEAFRKLHSLVAHFQARDALADVGGGGEEVPLGRGEVDWVELLPLLEEANYRGWTTIVRTQGDDKPGDLRRGVQFLKNVLLG